MPAATMRIPMLSRDNEQLQLITFEIDRLYCAVEILAVRDILKAPPASDHAGAPTNVLLRGQSIPVFELRTRLSMSSASPSSDTRIIVVEIHGKPIGFTVDRMRDDIRISREVVDTAPAMPCGIDPDFTAGVSRLDNRLLILLDLERLFAREVAPSRHS